VKPDGSDYQMLHSFEGNIFGGTPLAGLTEGAEGSLFGTTWSGGATNSGTVFQINKDGNNFKILDSFLGPFPGGDGSSPWGPLIDGGDGALYGTTYYGGANHLGTVFSLGKDGSNYMVLHSFSGDGAYPEAGLLKGRDGMLYGTTTAGYGTVFRLTTNGTGYATLFNFSVASNGSQPQSSLIEGLDGALYGTTYGGGTNGGGTIFKLNKDGTGFSMLKSFTGPDGLRAGAGLVIGPDGIFYGTTTAGGSLNFGTVFKMWPPQTPEMLGVTAGTGTVQVSFAGTAGAQYQLFRSTDLTNWTVLGAIVMPAEGISRNLDNEPPASGVFYRAKWLP